MATTIIHWVRLEPYRCYDNERCGICDGKYKHDHQNVACSRCGKDGLQENWPFDCCGITRMGPSKGLSGEFVEY